MRQYGFNFLWMFIYDGKAPPPADEKALDFLAANGLNFVRIPTDYRFWTDQFDYFNPREEALEAIDGYIAACRGRGLHVSLNMHRVPGYCINRPEIERDNLWLDKIAQDGLTFHWENFAKRYKGIPGEELSFDLINEPPGVGDRGMTRENHAAIIRRVTAAIRAVDPARPVTIDGIEGGGGAIPELADLGVTHSGRGYAPMAISHYQAKWWSGWPGVPENPRWPGVEWNGKRWDREALREVYQPWVEVEQMGVPIHIGEMGCYNRIPNSVALAWFKDLLGIFRERKWGYSFWNFEGPFGIIDHGREGARYERRGGYDVDIDLLNLFLENRVAE